MRKILSALIVLVLVVSASLACVAIAQAVPEPDIGAIAIYETLQAKEQLFNRTIDP